MLLKKFEFFNLIFFVFLDRFDLLMSKISFKKIKNILF